MLAEALSNLKIALRLSTSVKAVEHHVLAVLAKLGVHSRAQAITIVSALGLPPPRWGSLIPNIGNFPDVCAARNRYLLVGWMRTVLVQMSPKEETACHAISWSVAFPTPSRFR